VASIDDLKLSYRLFMRAYPFRRAEWRPGTPLAKPLEQCVIAVVTTAAFYLPSQANFDASVPGGDFSYREIPADADLPSLGIGHKSDAFDHTGIEQDKNLALPLDRLREMVHDGLIGALAEKHYSYMGSITAPGHLVQQFAPAVATLLKQQQTDAVLLTPV